MGPRLLTRLAAAYIAVGLLQVAPAAAIDWGISGGVHRMAVPEADSETGGFNVALIYRYLFAGGGSLAGYYRVYLDNDEDELDPDHVPLWLQTRHHFEADLYRWSQTTRLVWAADLSHKRNTVSSVEWQVRAFPAMALRFEGDRWRSSVLAGAGYFALEIDDDVPAVRGYTRDDLRNQTAAGWLRADGGCKISRSVDLEGRVEYWADQDTSLEFQYGLDLFIDTPGWVKNSRIAIEAEGTWYDLDPYSPTGLAASPGEPLPILPWDHDFLVRVVFEIVW